MKRILLALMLFAGTLSAQQNNATNTNFTNGLGASKFFNIPRGTVQPTTGVLVGSLFYHTTLGLQYYNGSTWKTVGLSGAGVTSFNGRTGAVLPLSGDYSKSDVGLGDVPNVDATNASNISSGTLSDSRLSSSIVTLTGTQTLTNKTLTSPVINSPTGLVKGDVGLSNVDNTSDLNKPISTATQTALDLKATDANVVHLTGSEVITGRKSFDKPLNLKVGIASDFQSGYGGLYMSGAGEFAFKQSNNTNELFLVLTGLSASRVLTAPDVNGTLATLNGGQTFTDAIWQGAVISSSKGGAGAISGILKANGSGVVSQAIPGTDYLTSASGVSSLTGTADEIEVSASTGAVTLSLPATINANTTGTAGNSALWDGNAYGGPYLPLAAGQFNKLQNGLYFTNNNFIYVRNAADTDNLRLFGLSNTDQLWLDPDGIGVNFGWSGNFTGNVTAQSFIKEGGVSSQFLKADGGASGLVEADVPALPISKTTGLQTALDSKANTDGTNATGTWPIGITGNASTTTLAANSTLWNGIANDFTSYGTSLSTLAGYDLTTGKVQPFQIPLVQTWLGLGSNAYESTAKLPLTGGTLTGALTGTSATFSEGVSVGVDDGTAKISAGGTNTHLTLAAMGSAGSILFNAGGVSNGSVSTVERGRFSAGGNLLIGTTTDNGNKLQVNGGISSSSLTAGRVPYIGTAGLIQDDADLTFDGTNLTVATPTAGGHAINKTYGDATYAPIASPTFTGTPSAPNAATDTQTSQIATTSFVLGQASVANPLANGTAASGSSKRYSREDHVHPTTILPFSVSTDVLSIAAGGTGSFSYGASGVAVGDVICIAPPDNGSGNGYPDLVFTAYCWTANQINVNIRNVGSSAIDLPTITYKFRVIK